MGTHTLDDVKEMVNSFYTFDMVLDKIDEKLTLEMIKQWHGSLMYRTRLYDMGLVGVFKKYQNKVLGAEFNTVNPWGVEDRLNEIIDNFYTLKEITIYDIARFHFQFQRTHPFKDGNGNIGRFIYLKQLLDNRLDLKYMNRESADEYKKALEESSWNNVKPLVDYLGKQKDFIKENERMF